MIRIMKKSALLYMILVVFIFGACQEKHPTGEWVSIFDGETLNGWKKSVENPESITVEEGAIKCAGARAHLFYQGDFKNFEFETEVKTRGKTNSGIFIHTGY